MQSAENWESGIGVRSYEKCLDIRVTRDWMRVVVEEMENKKQIFKNTRYFGRFSR